MPSFRHRTRYEVLEHARYLTFSCFRRLSLFQNDRIKDAFVEQLSQAKQKHRFRLFAWVVMPNHVHLLLLPALPEAPVPMLLRSLKQSFAQRIINHWRSLHAPILDRLVDSRGLTRFWQRGGGYDRNIVSDEELFEKAQYIHNNPVRAGLVDRVTDWKWSSARWYAGDRVGPIKIDPIV